METALRKSNKKGFTLVELVIVIAVLAILAAIAIPTVTNIINTANTNVDASNAQTIELALKSSYAEATAGTWTENGTAVKPADITVDQALAHQGLGNLAAIKLKSGAAFTYGSGKIGVDVSGGTTLAGTTLVKAALS